MITWLKRLFRRPLRKDEVSLSDFVVHEIVEQAEGTKIVVSLLDTNPASMELFYGAMPDDNDEVGVPVEDWPELGWVEEWPELGWVEE